MKSAEAQARSQPRLPDSHALFRDFTAAIAAHQGALAESLGVSLTEFKCLDLLHRRGSITPREMAREIGVTPAAVTGVVDKLEVLNFVLRQANPLDRRSIVIVPAATRLGEVEALYERVAEAVERLNGRYTADQLALIGDYLLHSIQIHKRDLATLQERFSSPL
jgi:DNA-binding MarR family transcriptional regulator